MSVRVKICGITGIEDARVAVEQGADALGFIFAKESPRCVSPLLARTIIESLPPFVAPVGVFVNQPRKEILEMVGQSGVRVLQFHGEESPDDVRGYALPVYKAFHVHEGFAPSALSEYPGLVYLLDAWVNGQRGGTGRTLDWKIAAESGRYGRIILGGGITPENVREAVRVVRPYAVDVNSGVEVSPGRKDSLKIRQLFAALRTT